MESCLLNPWTHMDYQEYRKDDTVSVAIMQKSYSDFLTIYAAKS